MKNIAVIAHNTITVNGDAVFLARGAILFVDESGGIFDVGAKIIVSK